MGVKKVLVIDVDETLLTIEPLFYLERFHRDYSKKEGVKVIFLDKEYYLMPRPYVRFFLEKLRNDYNLVAWSIADREITRKKLELLGLDNYFTYLFGKQDLHNGKKSLRWLADFINIPLDALAAIDDNPKLYDIPRQVIPITSWLAGSHDDNELIKAIKLVKIKFGEIVPSKMQEIRSVTI